MYRFELKSGLTTVFVVKLSHRTWFRMLKKQQPPEHHEFPRNGGDREEVCLSSSQYKAIRWEDQQGFLNLVCICRLCGSLGFCWIWNDSEKPQISSSFLDILDLIWLPDGLFLQRTHYAVHRLAVLVRFSTPLVTSTNLLSRSGLNCPYREALIFLMLRNMPASWEWSPIQLILSSQRIFSFVDMNDEDCR